MIVNDTVANLITAAVFLPPTAWVTWHIVKTGLFRVSTLLVFAVFPFLYLGASMLCLDVSSDQTTVFSREGERLTFVVFTKTVLFTRRSEAVTIPDGAQAYVEAEDRKGWRKSYPHSYNYTRYDLYLGQPPRGQWVTRASNGREAKAMADAVNDFVRGNAPRLELPPFGELFFGFHLFLGLFCYILGLSGCWLIVWTLVGEHRLLSRPMPEPMPQPMTKRKSKPMPKWKSQRKSKRKSKRR